MQKKKIFILLGHPDCDSFNGTLADEYEKGAIAGGYDVRRQNIGEMVFDPILHHGYKGIQPLEPDLISFQDNVRWADHFVILYPTWFSTMPALLKGVFDRAWLPGFAYHFQPNALMWKRLMKGKSAHIFVTSDTIPIVLRIMFGDTTNEIRKGILWFAGFSPLKTTKFGYLKHFGLSRRERIKRKMYKLGKRGK